MTLWIYIHRLVSKKWCRNQNDVKYVKALGEIVKIKGNKCHPIEQQRNRLSYWICILFFEKLNRYLIAFVPFRAIVFLSNVTMSIGKNILFGSSSCQRKVVLVRGSSYKGPRLSKFVQKYFFLIVWTLLHQKICM